jgi:sugar transferase (PEP-CTERM/EpsH1 system associated)
VSAPPLIVHIIYRLSAGGLENGLVNLLNRMPADKYRHAVICLKESTDFSKRIQRKDVRIISLHRKDGQDFSMFVRLFWLLIEMQPDIVHTRNLATLECQFPAWLSGVKHRVHGEHGWDIYDPYGRNRKYQWLRRLFRPLVHRYIPLSRQLTDYLLERIHVSPNKIRQICNGVDTDIFHPAQACKPRIAGCPFPDADQLILIGTVGRMHGVKDQLTLVSAFLYLLKIRPEAKFIVRLVLVGEGPLRVEAGLALQSAGAENLAWMPGERDDIPEILRGLDIFVLPSKAEGISNVILEAMATGLPVIATSVGGNPELVVDGLTGRLTPPEDPQAMAEILAEYLDNPYFINAHGVEGRRRVLNEFSMDAMVAGYSTVYEELLQIH